MTRAKAAAVSLTVVFACLGGTMLLGAGLKAKCANPDWSDGRQYRYLCYSDIPPLLFTEQLTGGRVPYLDRCQPQSDEPVQCDEYPVLTMYFMRLAASVSGDSARLFFAANGVLLFVCAGAIAVSLYMLVGDRALFFVLAPTLLLAGYVNWDMFAAALAMAAALAFFGRRDRLAGILLGLGAAAKLYPALLVVPFVAERLREREPDRALSLGYASAGAWLAVNAPFAIVSPTAWSNFFRYNAGRPNDWDSLWMIACRDASWCPSNRWVNFSSAALFVALVIAVWGLKSLRHHDFPRWSLSFPIVVVFLLTSKVYSPQYGLWLLPLFALALPNMTLFIAFSIADVAVYLTRFRFFGDLLGFDFGWPQWWFETAVVARAVVLVACVVAWVLLPTPEVPLRRGALDGEVVT